MDKKTDRLNYWGRLIRNLREAHNLSQTDMALRLETDQSTVCRWERGVTEPNFHFRKRIDEMAREAGLATLGDVSAIVNHSPFPMILVSRDMTVVSASKSSGFRAGTSCISQTPPEEQAFLLEFQRDVDASGFWDQALEKLDYEFNFGDEARKAVLVPVVIRTEVFGLVQKAW